MPGGSLSPILEGARLAGRELLYESEAFDLLDGLGELGIATPARFLVGHPRELDGLDLDGLSGDRLILKIVVPELAHKTELGGVAPVTRSALAETARSMWGRLAALEPAGLLVSEFVEHDASLGAELLVGVRWTPDFGPVVTIAPGGTDAEYLARHLEGGCAATLLSQSLFAAPGSAAAPVLALAGKSFLARVTEPYRGRPPAVLREDLIALARRLLELGERAMPGEISEIEINPLVFLRGRPTALDALVRLGTGERGASAPRPMAKMGRLLAPRSLAIVGVSTGMNPGRIILDNVLDSGFECHRIHLVKPGLETLAGCRCYPDVESLPERVDLAVLCIAANELPAAVERFVAARKAESLILIAGGLGESPGSESARDALEEVILASRAAPGGGPVVNGGNCLGVRSVPGCFDTLFIPRHKLSYPRVPPTPLALVSQSGAFAVARASRLAELNPRYVVSVGNQIDLTLGDYLTYLEGDPEIRVFAFYVEGFRPGDGARWLEAAARSVAAGRAVVLYRAGRTAEGSRAAASHTASIAGDYAVTRELARAAGVLVADSLEDFEDLTRIACALDSRPLAGRRLGALSNAGFECVAVADGLSGLELARLGAATEARLDGLLAHHRLSSIVAPRNPLDVTPILGDEAFAAASRLVLEDPGVDLGLVGCVPLTGALQTLAAGDGHAEDTASEGAIAQRLGRLWKQVDKPWVAAVDGGPAYDAMARAMRRQGIPVFRSVDRALRMLARYADWRLRQGSGA